MCIGVVLGKYKWVSSPEESYKGSVNHVEEKRTVPTTSIRS